MTNIVRTRLLTFIAGLIIVPVGTVLAVMFAKGYRPDLQKGQITVSGILSAHTYPENAQIIINGQPASSVTNANLNLPPGQYTVEFKKEGYSAWKKDLLIEKEIVTTATAVLFPTVAALKPINYQPAYLVTLSPDGTKVVYLSQTNQIYSLDLSESPLGILNRDSRLIGALPPGLSRSAFQSTWSPDSRFILIADPTTFKNASPSAYFIDPNNQRISSAASSVVYLLQSWKDRRITLQAQMFNTLPPALKPVLATASADLVWSPRENKLLYTATASAALPDKIKPPLPGSNTQLQNRQLQPGRVYVYDLEEDRNFQIDEIVPVTPTPKKTKAKTSQTVSNQVSLPNNGWSWFPTSSHLYRVRNNQVTITEYDGQNPTIVYSGPLYENTAIPYPSGKQMLLLTRFETTPAASSSAEPSLYALTLR